ncbi:MAG: flavodoxin family protein [Lachnospiraceae bacterium]|nr:flavodoxin family protein [Lachnospiraceae bacterium]
MNLVIHDLTEEEWSKVASKYDGWKVISDNHTIKPCIGCFGCWVKSPGECVIKDGYDQMGALIHHADEVVVISRYTYGGLSSFVKNVFDRSIGWVSPYFEVYEGEMHHKKRYPEDKPMSFIFSGKGLTKEDQDKARGYVDAACRNFHAKVKSVTFEELETAAQVNVQEGSETAAQATGQEVSGQATQEVSETMEAGRLVILNCSLRADNANSKRFMKRILPLLDGEHEIINLSSYLAHLEKLVEELLAAEKIVLGMPLYVDGVPSAPLRIMEALEKSGKAAGKKIYVVANMGLYESKQIKHLLSIMKTWSETCGSQYCGGLAIGAGEMLKMMMRSENIDKGPSKNMAEGVKKIAAAINGGEVMDDIYADVYKFSRTMYMFCANASWPLDAKKNGLKKKDLFRQL